MSETQELWWAVRRTSGHRWSPEDGWANREQASRSAAFYRRDRHRPAVVVFGDPRDSSTFADRLMDAVLSNAH